MLESLKSAVNAQGALSSAPGGVPYAIHFRTLGNVAYFMLSLNTDEKTIRAVEDRIWDVISLT